MSNASGMLLAGLCLQHVAGRNAFFMNHMNQCASLAICQAQLHQVTLAMLIVISATMHGVQECSELQ